MRWSKKSEAEYSVQHRPVASGGDHQHQSLAAMDNLAAMSSAEARKLDLGLVVEKDSLKSDEDGHDPDTHGLLIGQQYILERPDSEGGPQVVKLNANGQIVACEMLPHVGQMDSDHQSLVLHVVPQGGLKEAYNIQHLRGSLLSDERYIETLPTASHYETELLSGGDISEEDRRIAQALMAVQYGQQQKHKMNLEPLVAGGSGAEANVIMSVADSMMVEADHLSKSVDHSQMVVEYMVDGSQYEPKVVRLMQHEQDLMELAPARVEELHQAQHLKPHGTIILRKTLTAPANEIRHDGSNMQHHMVTHVGHIKHEEDEDLETEEDLEDSDYEAGKETRSSRRSLPHKKRIPKKLKNVKTVEKILRCIKCAEVFPTQAELNMHKQSHNKKQQPQLPQPSFNCQLCSKCFPSQIKFFEHLKAHYEPIKTDDDDQSSHIQLAPIEEIETKMVHTSVIVQELPPALPPPMVCPHCSKVFRRQKALEAHINSAHSQVQNSHLVLTDTAVYMSDGLVPVAVEEVDKKEWTSSTELTPMEAAALPAEVEMRENTVIVPTAAEEQLLTTLTVQEMPSEEPTVPEEEGLESVAFHLCDHCGTGFQLKSQLLAHIQESHGDPKRKTRGRKEEVTAGASASAVAAASKKSEQLTCPHCGRVFNHRNSLVYHLRSHTGERPHQCEVCGKSFFAASALKVHMRLHSGDKPYKCELCGRHFRQWGDLKYHCISIHTEEKQYQCEYCGKDFARKYSLIVHRRIHTGEKNYRCEFCGKTFRASSYLQNHRRIHTGEKPHPCEICGKPFRVRSDMKRHMNTHNRDRGDAAGAGPSAVVSTPEGSSMEVGVAEMGAEEVALPDGAVVITEESLSQPMNLNMAVPAAEQGEEVAAEQLTTAEQTIGTEEVHENGMQYQRDPLETVRGGDGNTLYVWPIYMG